MDVTEVQKSGNGDFSFEPEIMDDKLQFFFVIFRKTACFICQSVPCGHISNNWLGARFEDDLLPNNRFHRILAFLVSF